MNIIDLHCDTIMRLYYGEALRSMPKGHLDLTRMKAGDYLAQCFAIFVPTHKENDMLPVPVSPERYFDKAYAVYEREIARNSDMIAKALSVSDILANEACGKMSAILTVEDSVTVNGDIAKIDDLYRKGVRMATFTWNYENSLAWPQSTDPKIHAKGLKDFGIEAVRRFNELGIAIDVSHLNEGGFWDVIKYSSSPVITSLFCAASLRPIPRNLSDEQIRALADKGGVIGVNFYHDFLREPAGPEDRLTRIDDVLRNIRYMLDLAGSEAVALGSDYDGIESELEWTDCAGSGMLTERIAEAFGRDTADKICRGNALRAFKDIWGR